MHLKRMHRTTGVVLVASLTSGVAAHADSAIVGTVLNVETKEPVPDVVVSATSPNVQGEQVVVTDPEGHYRIPELPPGVYTLRFEREMFETSSRAELTLLPDQTLQVDVELPPGDTSDDYGCGPPPVDVESSGTGLSVYERAIPSIPLNLATGRFSATRSFEGLAGLDPGARSDAYGVSINGSSPFENAYRVDGLSTNDPIRGLNALPLSIEFIQEVDVRSGGYMAEYGRATGGILHARTRSGTNELHGSVFGNWAPGVLGGTPTPVHAPGLTISGRNVLVNQGDFGATLGGPILKDRLWFFAGVVPELSSVEHTRELHARVPGQDDSVRRLIPGTSRTFFADERGMQAMGKLTYRIDPNHFVSLSAITTPTRSGGTDRLTVDPLTGEVREVINSQPLALETRELAGNTTTAALHYAGSSMDHGLFLDANLGWSLQTASSRPSDNPGAGPSSGETYAGPVTGVEIVPDAERYCGATPAEQLQNCAVQDYDIGGTGRVDFDRVDRYQGNVQVTWPLTLGGLHLLKAGADAEHLAYERERGGAGASYTSNLLGGFVRDSWTIGKGPVTLNAGIRYDSQWVYTEEGRLAVALRHQLSPRVGLLVAAPLRNGWMRLFAHYAKYHGQMPFELANLGGLEAPGVSELVPTSSSELLAGIEYEVLRDTLLSATYTHRSLDSVIENLSRDDGSSFFLGNPGSGAARDFPKAERTHDAAAVALRHAFSDGWFAQASYTWSRLYGNQGALFQNPMGLLPEDRTHSVKAFGSRELFLVRKYLSLNLGLAYQGRSGTPIVLPRGETGERTPWVHSIDPHLEVRYRLRRDNVVSLSLDVFNLFNFQEVTRVDERQALPLQYQTPRRVRFGLRYSF
ncbi:TonB-dependent receptor [Archangium violaceum]|uniref:TonB-dependent receptor n=1 Tax=Archangium violaceum TaxID=83451 RepID=UPI00193C667D|nr:TonB-dependent receptor [Archangium violaceum]QRK04819.1 TonB-dependent receptor [Archangium violaceum]